MSDDVEPCRVCGSPVQMQRVKRVMAYGTEYGEVRHCTNGECDSNKPPESRLAVDVP